jgi:hypothetical protein
MGGNGSSAAGLGLAIPFNARAQTSDPAIAAALARPIDGPTRRDPGFRVLAWGQVAPGGKIVQLGDGTLFGRRFRQRISRPVAQESVRES